MGDDTVLIVDDSEFFANMLTREIQDRADLSPEACYDSEAAIEAVAERDDIECIVSDYLMPEMDGLDLLDAVRSEHGDLPFIILTGQGSENVASRAIKRGATDYITKGTILEDSEFGLLLNRIEKGIDHHRTEKQLRESRQRLKDRNEHLTVLNKMLRHDIRNDLQLVLGYLGELDEVVDDEAIDLLVTAREATENAVDITDIAGDIVSAVVDTDGNSASVPFAPTVRRQTEEIASAYPNATVTINGSIPEIDVSGSELFGTVVRNLITNGIKHNDRANPKIVVSTSVDDDHANLRVADNGPGISDERKRRIFGEGESGTSGGSGIGLYLVKAFVERHDGDVDIEDRVEPFDDERPSSSEPLGSVFTVSLPKSD